MATPIPKVPATHLESQTASGQAPASTEAKLRRLAALESEFRDLLGSVGQSELSAAQSAVYFKLADAARRAAHVGMVSAAGAVASSQAHRLAQGSIEEVFALRPEHLASGAPFPVSQLLPASAKAHYRSEVELLCQLGDLKAHAAKALLKSHRQLVGNAQQPAQFPVLAQQFHNPQRNPEVISQAAARLAALQLRGRALKQAESAVARSSSQGQSAVSAELKSLSDKLSAPDLPEREAVHERCAGLRYRGLGPSGHVWELICTTVDHEFLCTLADRLVNPKLAVNRASSAFGPGAEQNPANPSQNPRDEYNDPASVKARKLLHTVLETLRRQGGSRRSSVGTTRGNTTGNPNPVDAAQPESGQPNPVDHQPQAEQDPLPPMIDLIVTIDYQALLAQTTAAGITSHGQRISATALRQSAAIAGIIPMVLGTSGEVMDYGRRRRLFTAAQTRAVVGRDRGCINPGCRMPAHRCEVNHCQPWHRGGKTCVDNGCLLCKNCHLAFHTGHFRIKMVNGVPYVQQSAERDPQRCWRRNWVWHPDAEALAA